MHPPHLPALTDRACAAADSGPLNSWDRAPYLTLRGVPEGTPSDMPKPRIIERNFLVNDHSANWPLDHDDGSDHYKDRYNVLIHGGSKNLNGYDKQIYGNLFVRPDIGAGMRHCHNNFAAGTEDPRPFLESWFNNTCITSEPDGDGGWSDSGIYNFGACDIPALPEGRSSSSTHTASNTFLTPSGDASKVNVSCANTSALPAGLSGATFSFATWQAQGYDAGSKVGKWSGSWVDDAMETARALLEMPPRAARTSTHEAEQ